MRECSNREIKRLGEREREREREREKRERERESEPERIFICTSIILRDAYFQIHYVVHGCRVIWY